MRRAPVQLVRGEIVPAFGPRLADALPYGLGSALEPGADPLLVRIDLEDAHLGELLLGRPTLERYERGRDFELADASGHVHVRVGAGGPFRLHDRVELHLDGPFRRAELPATVTRPRRVAYLRALRVGDPVYVLGRLRLDAEAPPAPAAGAPFAGYRDAPPSAVFSGEDGPLQLFDEAAFQQLAAWHVLPWYRKLSVMVWNR